MELRPIPGRLDTDSSDTLTTPTSEHLSTDSNLNIVWWDGDNDPEHPYNWPVWRTRLNCTLVSCASFVAPLATTLFAPGVPQLMREFHSDSEELTTFVVSIYNLGMAFGPLLIAPLSEVYGRVKIYHVCNVGFVAFVIGCALAPNLQSLIALRFLSGVFGACFSANGGGSIADMVPQERRAGAMAAFTLGPLLGPIAGPIAGGFITSAKGWRWNFWLVAIVGTFLSLVMALTLKESFHPVILEAKAARLRKSTGNPLVRSKLDSGLTFKHNLRRSLVRPVKILVYSPVVTLISLYIAVTFGYLNLMFTSFTEIFENYYGFTPDQVGLAYLGLGVGSLVGVALFRLTSDRYLAKKAADANAAGDNSNVPNGGMKPGYRLTNLPIGSLLVPIGLFIYGWTTQYHIHWMVPIVATGLISCGNILTITPLQMYLIDAFHVHAASALAASIVLRSIVGAALPLAGLRMYSALGIGWGNSLLGFISLLFLPLTFVFLRYGEYLRKRFEIKTL
ncbi:MFS general substrate transporter [Colletotrichum zoysiae]|uniref:MFS general substrate transporter n=1 Tax=Colletotrichum zoysiae TaxID=1216348 RepID=A0AAD9M5D6_9PEZI|nr:MFS general substrate transporter [Colletotrichum zoysiae]